MKGGIPKIPPKKFECQSFKNYNKSEFIKDLNQVPWSVVNGVENVDVAVFLWEKLFSEIANEHAPLKIQQAKEKWTYIDLKRNIESQLSREDIMFEYLKQSHSVYNDGYYGYSGRHVFIVNVWDYTKIQPLAWMRTSSTISFFEQDKSKNQTRPHRNHHRDNIAMYYVYISSWKEEEKNKEGEKYIEREKNEEKEKGYEERNRRGKKVGKKKREMSKDERREVGEKKICCHKCRGFGHLSAKCLTRCSPVVPHHRQEKQAADQGKEVILNNYHFHSSLDNERFHQQVYELSDLV
ncbi:hypothetical protein pdam_00022391 [Pocillopora damicornis]|uniref:Uncharacterized protein n=1 Tax=Pocillopora damicornis TaxID=46731 RepID=A0A3M6TIE2_POCDA|nr:hypothetical protein pdam_00022391 [Pocillopora damicornis]